MLVCGMDYENFFAFEVLKGWFKVLNCTIQPRISNINLLHRNATSYLD